MDPAVGVVLTEQGKLGGRVEVGEPLLWVHACTQESLDAALARLVDAYRLSDEPVAAPPVLPSDSVNGGRGIIVSYANFGMMAQVVVEVPVLNRFIGVQRLTVIFRTPFLSYDEMI